MKLKVCLIGATGVGKSSLAARFVHSIFSDVYRTTIGVKIEAIEVRRPTGVVQLVIWDLSGEDEFQSVQPAYVAGTAGFLLVVDGTRTATADTGLVLANRIREVAGLVPFVLVVNKTDLEASWEVRAEHLRDLERMAYSVVRTSARTGAGVAAAFERLVDAILAQQHRSGGLRWT